MIGDDGNDSLIGGDGNDYLIGDDGNDGSILLFEVAQTDNNPLR
ncbi:hypothetical protein [Nostoc sp. DedQUE09]